MKDHLEEKITLSDIADFSGYSITRINALFQNGNRNNTYGIFFLI